MLNFGTAKIEKKPQLFVPLTETVITAPLQRGEAIFFYNASLSAVYEKLVVKVRNLTAEEETQTLCSQRTG